MSKVRELKERLLTELISQFDNGVRGVDPETGEIVTTSVDSKIMTVASKVIKDFAHEADDAVDNQHKIEKLRGYLEQRKGLKVVS